MESIYVLSTRDKSLENKYKIGKHTGSPKKLILRYITALIDHIILMFEPTFNYDYIEKKIKDDLYELRIDNINGNKSEWVKMDFTILKQLVIKTINEHNTNYDIDCNNVIPVQIVDLEKIRIDDRKKEGIIFRGIKLKI